MLQNENLAALGALGISVIVRQGEAKPDTSTPDRLRQALLEARSVVHATWTSLGSLNADQLRDEGLAGEIFDSLREAQGLIKAWRRLDTTARPPSALGYKPPAPQVAAWLSTGDAARIERLRPMISLERVGSAEEVAAAVLFLMSDEAPYITGANLRVSGGG